MPTINRNECTVFSVTQTVLLGILDLLLFLLNCFVNILRNLICSLFIHRHIWLHSLVCLTLGKWPLCPAGWNFLPNEQICHLDTSDITGKPCLSSPGCLWTNIMTGLGVTVFISVHVFFAVWPVSCRVRGTVMSDRAHLWGFAVGGLGYFVQLNSDYSAEWLCLTDWHYFLLCLKLICCQPSALRFSNCVVSLWLAGLYAGMFISTLKPEV